MNDDNLIENAQAAATELENAIKAPRKAASKGKKSAKKKLSAKRKSNVKRTSPKLAPKKKAALKHPIVASRKRYGSKVRTARVKEGLSQRALAKRMHITQPALSNVERGAFKAGPDMQAKIKKALGVNP